MKIYYIDNKGKEQTVNIPSQWKGVSLFQFQEMLKITSVENPKTDNETIIQLIELFSEEQVNDILTAELNGAKLCFLKLFEQKLSSTPKTEFRIGRKKYLFEPDLNKIFASQFIEIELQISMSSFWESIHTVLAVVCREKKPFSLKNVISKYEFDSVEKRAIKFQECLSIEDVYGLALFFYHFVNQYLQGTNQSLVLENK